MKRAPTTELRRTASIRKKRRVDGYKRPYAVGRTSLTEVKSCDTTVAAATLVTLGSVTGTEPSVAYTGLTEVNLIRQGATVSQRIGNKIVIKSIDCWFTYYVSSLTHAGVARAMLIYDRQPNGAFPAIADIIKSQPAGTAADFSGINISNKSRFQMIRDEALQITGGSDFAKVVHWYCKGKWETEFGADAGTIADFRTGAIYFIIYETLSVVAVANVGDFHCRIRYWD